MTKSIYLINPANDFPSYLGFEAFAGLGGEPVIATADLAITTLAGMFPEDFDVHLCEEHVNPIDFHVSVDYVGITGKISQQNRMIAIAQKFREQGKTVIFGGPYASLSPDALRPHCDILVRGEIEEIFDEICDDLRTSRWKTEYVGGRPDISNCGIPKWQGYPNDRALSGTLQTSRGCPFECEFCDVIQYLGRKQRHKSINQVLAELDELYRYGYRAIFLADDNFTVRRSHAKEVLVAIRDWNRRQENGHVHFTTQVSIDAAKDDELMRLCAEAGLTTVFIGIETSNEGSLKEAKKRQNTGVNLSDQVRKFFEQGIYVIGGMIVGFDADGLDTFKRQYEFAASLSVPILTVGALVAPEATPLHDRMKKLGRLAPDGSETPATPWRTNFNPSQMTREQLFEGIRWLCNNLYHPTVFADRLFSFVASFTVPQSYLNKGRSQVRSSVRSVDVDMLKLIAKLAKMGPEEGKLLSYFNALAMKGHEATPVIMKILAQYVQIRYMYEKGSFWEPQLVNNPPPY